MNVCVVGFWSGKKNGSKHQCFVRVVVFGIEKMVSIMSVYVAVFGVGRRGAWQRRRAMAPTRTRRSGKLGFFRLPGDGRRSAGGTWVV